MKEQLIDLILHRLNERKEDLIKQFFLKHPITVARHFILDDFLPLEVAEEIYNQFPKPSKMRLLNSPGELKFKYSYVKDESSLLKDIYLAIQDSKVIRVIEEITGIMNQVSNQSKNTGIISTLLKGHYINPHLDNSHDVDKKLYQTLNLLYYVSPNWHLKNGGNYELWDESVKSRIIVPSLFNRLVVTETNQTSWHSVNPVVCNQSRCCILNYYYSEQPPRHKEYFHASSIFKKLIIPRPEQKIRRAIFNIQNYLVSAFSKKE